MRGISAVVAACMLSPAVAAAHVTVRPRESKPGVEERYTVRVPTEGKVSTTSVEFDVPADVEITEVADAPGARHVETRDGARRYARGVVQHDIYCANADRPQAGRPASACQGHPVTARH